MPRLSLAGAAGALALLVLGLAPGPTDGRPAARARLDAACKPLAPIALELTLPGGDPTSAWLPVEFSLRPALELQQLQWSWELSPGVVLAQGEAQGPADPGRGALTSASAVLRAPPDGAFHRARLVATARFTGHDQEGASEPAVAIVERTITWGELPVPVPVTSGVDLDTGALAPIALVPARHEPATRGGR